MRPAEFLANVPCESIDRIAVIVDVLVPGYPAIAEEDVPNSAIDVFLPKIPGGKKLIYNHIDIPLTAIDDFAEAGKTDPLFAELDKICKAHNGLWNDEAEKYLLENAKAI